MSSFLINPYRFASGLDADAAAYIAAVEAADADVLEEAVKTALNAFVVGCKADGNWDAITMCIIMRGVRTLAGCKVPLKGSAPTDSTASNPVFEEADYTRATGLKSNGTTTTGKSFDVGAHTDLAQNNVHRCAFCQGSESNSRAYFGSSASNSNASKVRIGTGSTTTSMGSRCHTDTLGSAPAHAVVTRVGFHLLQRQNSTEYEYITDNESFTHSGASVAPASGTLQIYRDVSGVTTARLSFYSHGTYIPNSSAYKTRVNTLLTALAV